MLELFGTFAVANLMGPLLLIGIGGLLLFVIAALPKTPRRVREMFRCPLTRRVVIVDFLVSVGAARPSGVASCTAFRDPDRVTCSKACREYVIAESASPVGSSLAGRCGD